MEKFIGLFIINLEFLLFLKFSEEANKTGGPMNHIPIMPMPIPSFQRNWQTLKSSVFGHNNLPEKSTTGQLISE